MVNGAIRCVLCGHRVGFKPRFTLCEIARNVIDTFRARRRWWNEPQFCNGVFYY
jgi:hypothetical protein